MNRAKIALFLAILVLGFTLRLYRFNNPIADWHEWRQADTSSVSRNFVLGGFDLLHPRFDDLSNVASGKDNPQGYRFVEFPVYNLFQAGFFKIFGVLTLEEWGRLVTIFSSLCSGVFIFFIVRKRAGEVAGAVSLFFFSLLPYSIYYGRVILPDPMMVTAILAGIYFFDKFLSEAGKNKKRFYFVLSAVFTAAALLIKPFAIFFTLPIAYLAFDKFGASLIKKWYLWLYLAVTILPLVLWRGWMTQFPQGIPASDWLFNQGNIRLKGSFFYWIFADRLSRLILGYFGISLLIFGFLSKIKKQNFFFFLSFAVSSLAYLVIIAGGNVQHDYYQILILPTVAIFLGLGADFLLSTQSNKPIPYLIFGVIVFFALFFSWYFVRDYFNINNSAIVTGGQIIDQMTPKDAKIIALYNGDTAFLYQTRRKGWASLEKDLAEMIAMGADYLALTNPTKSDLFFSKNYKIVYSSDTLLLYDLHLPAGRQDKKP